MLIFPLLYYYYSTFRKMDSIFYFLNIFCFCVLCFFDCTGPLLMLTGFLYLQKVRATLQLWFQGFSLCGFSCCTAQTLGEQTSVIVVHRLSYPEACGIFPDWGSNLCPLLWQVDSFFFFFFFILFLNFT